jgi:hypothetical protein
VRKFLDYRNFLFLAFLFASIPLSFDLIGRSIDGGGEDHHDDADHHDDGDHHKKPKPDKDTEIESYKKRVLREIDDLVVGGKKHKLSKKNKKQIEKIKKEIKHLKGKHYKKAKKKINQLKDQALRFIRSGGKDSKGKVEFEANKRVYQQKLEELMRSPYGMSDKLAKMNLQNLSMKLNEATEKSLSGVMDDIDSQEQQIKLKQTRSQKKRSRKQKEKLRRQKEKTDNIKSEQFRSIRHIEDENQLISIINELEPRYLMSYSYYGGDSMNVATNILNIQKVIDMCEQERILMVMFDLSRASTSLIISKFGYPHNNPTVDPNYPTLSIVAIPKVPVNGIYDINGAFGRLASRFDVAEVDLKHRTFEVEATTVIGNIDAFVKQNVVNRG